MSLSLDVSKWKRDSNGALTTNLYSLPPKFLQSALQFHTPAEVKIEEKSIISKENSTQFNCIRCNLVFSTLADLKTHHQSPEHLLSLRTDLLPTVEDDSSSPKKKIIPSLEINNAHNVLLFSRALFLSPDNRHPPLDNPLDVLSKLVPLQQSQYRIAIFLVRSGKFAGALYHNGKMTHHSVISRYTTRRKAGGAQSAHDNNNGNANSAGANLRRMGEIKFAADIRRLLNNTWAKEVAQCCSIFLSLSDRLENIFFWSKKEKEVLASHRRDALLSLNVAESFAPFVKGDERMRVLPFVVYKPKLEEVERVHEVITRVVCVPKEWIVEKREGLGVEREDGEKKEESEESEESEEEDGEEEREHAFVALCRMSACYGSVMDVLLAIGGQRDSDSDTEEEREERRGEDRRGEEREMLKREILSRNDVENYVRHGISLKTGESPLHVAARKEDAKLIRMLLRVGRFDPCAMDDTGAVPYVLCQKKACKVAFSECRQALGEGYCDWNRAQVPARMNSEAETANKKKEKKKRQRQNKKLLQAQQEEEEAERKKQEEILLEQSKGPQCFQCKKLLDPKMTISRLDQKFCSSACASQFAREIQIQALEKRMGKI